MRIDRTQAGEVQPKTAHPASTPQTGSDRPATHTGDSVALSRLSEQLHRAREAAAGVPEVRAEKVAALKQQVQNGTYMVDNQALAEKLLKAL